MSESQRILVHEEAAIVLCCECAFALVEQFGPPPGGVGGAWEYGRGHQQP